MFGKIEVKDAGLERALYLNGQKQGGAYLRPSAAIVASTLPHEDPGPISSSTYPLGWLMAGVMNPSSTCLMVGLGSGAGAIQLLYNFPYVDLTIIEIDPVMVQMAIDNFPLLDYYMDRGQLNIVVADADEYLKDNYDDWDVGMADAYDGGQHLLDSYISRLCGRCEHVYLNVIDRLNGPSMGDLVEVMAKQGKAPAEVFRASQMDYTPFTSRANWILTSQSPDYEKAGRFVPFDDIEDVHALDTQRDWDRFLSSSLSAVA